jgi:hypothetical protein
LVITANAAVGKAWASHATGVLAGLTAGLTFLIGLSLAFGLLKVTPQGQPLGVGVGVMATAVVAALLASRPVREVVARALPMDPDSPVHAYALVLAVILFGSTVATTLFVNVLALDQSQPPVTPADLAASELPYLVIALFGVGLYMRRNFSGAAERLGLVRPAWWQIAIALACAGAFFALTAAADQLAHVWTPQEASQLDKTIQQVFGQLGNPLGVAAVAVLPGICEEILFRGALQPRLGLFVTAALFTAIHTQYGISLVALSVLVVAIGLGVIRKYTNTTTSMICHVTYNLLAGVGIASSLLGVATGVEVGLVAVSGYALWLNRRRRGVPAPVS